MRYTRFVFCEGSAPSGKTHVYAWDGSRWTLPCQSALKPRPASFKRPLCQTCEQRTSQLHPYPVRQT